MIQTGTVWYGYATTPGWNLNTGTGDRSFTIPDISFNPPFSAPPHIVLAVGGIDSERATNLRITLEPYDVETAEFNIKVNTWGDTLLYQVWITWIAYG